MKISFRISAISKTRFLSAGGRERVPPNPRGYTPLASFRVIDQLIFRTFATYDKLYDLLVKTTQYVATFSKTVRDKIAYGESNGHVIDDVT